MVFHPKLAAARSDTANQPMSCRRNLPQYVPEVTYYGYRTRATGSAREWQTMTHAYHKEERQVESAALDIIFIAVQVQMVGPHAYIQRRGLQSACALYDFALKYIVHAYFGDLFVF
jgi:hypothetical protein